MSASGHKPTISVQEIESTNGKKYVNYVINCGTRTINFDPEWWPDLAEIGDLIFDSAVELKQSRIVEARSKHD